MLEKNELELLCFFFKAVYDVGFPDLYYAASRRGKKARERKNTKIRLSRVNSIPEAAQHSKTKNENTKRMKRLYRYLGGGKGGKAKKGGVRENLVDTCFNFS